LGSSIAAIETPKSTKMAHPPLFHPSLPKPKPSHPPFSSLISSHPHLKSKPLNIKSPLRPNSDSVNPTLNKSPTLHTQFPSFCRLNHHPRAHTSSHSISLSNTTATIVRTTIIPHAKPPHQYQLFPNNKPKVTGHYHHPAIQIPHPT
jgi:hypothetical protein